VNIAVDKKRVAAAFRIAHKFGERQMADAQSPIGIRNGIYGE
jgi:hypothetical protein